MIVVNLNIKNSAYEKVMYILNSLPKQDVKIVQKRAIDEIDPTTLPKDDFDYMSKEELKAIYKEIEEAKRVGFDNLKSYDEIINEL